MSQKAKRTRAKLHGLKWVAAIVGIITIFAIAFLQIRETPEYIVYIHSEYYYGSSNL